MFIVSGRCRAGLAAAASAWLALCSPAAAATSITGAGSTFAAPLYAAWGEASKAATGVALNYQAIGSGAGQAQIFNRTVDFGASDAPVPAAALAAHKLLQIPTAIGGVVTIVNIPGIAANALKLDGATLAAIYLGQITSWNDPRLAALNPGLKLPDLDIAPVYRADGSGTTYVFTDYLSMVSPDWAARVGKGTSVKWAAGQGAKGSAGVAGEVKNIEGAIGYVEAAYASHNGLVTTSLRNKSGRFVTPSAAGFAAAAAAANWSAAPDFAVDLNNEPGDNAWPIGSATFVLLPRDPANQDRASAVTGFFAWGLDQGDAVATLLGYVPLPPAVKASVKAACATLAPHH